MKKQDFFKLRIGDVVKNDGAEIVLGSIPAAGFFEVIEIEKKRGMKRIRLEPIGTTDSEWLFNIEEDDLDPESSKTVALIVEQLIRAG